MEKPKARSAQVRTTTKLVRASREFSVSLFFLCKWYILQAIVIQASRVSVSGGRAMHCRIDSQKKVSTNSTRSQERNNQNKEFTKKNYNWVFGRPKKYEKLHGSSALMSSKGQRNTSVKQNRWIFVDRESASFKILSLRFQICICHLWKLTTTQGNYNTSDVIKIHCNCTFELTQVLNFIWGGWYSYFINKRVNGKKTIASSGVEAK